MEITIHTGSMGDCSKVNIEWFDENNVLQQNELEIEVLNIDKPRTLTLKLDGKQFATIPNPLPRWCAHISKSMSGIWCYSGVPHQGNVEIGKWQYCPICGANRPN